MADWTNDEDYGKAVTRMVAAFGRRMAGADAEHLPLLTGLRDAIDQAERVAIAAMRERGVTWAEIGDAYGMTRQAAQKRFGKVA